MIKLRCSIDEDHFLLSAYGSDAMWYSTADGLTHIVGHLGVQLSGEGLPPSYSSRTVQFGRFEQGEMEIGKLHDKGVFHLNAWGDLTFSGTAHASHTQYPNYGPNYRYYGRMYPRAGGGDGVLFGQLTDWGSDAVFSQSFESDEATWYAWGHATTTAAYSSQIQESIRFNGIHAIVETRYHRDAQENSGYWPSEPAYDERHVIFLRLTPGAMTPFVRSAVFNCGRDGDGTWVVEFDDHSGLHDVDTLSPIAANYDVYMQPKYDGFHVTTVMSQQDLYDQMDWCERWFYKEESLRVVERVFTQSPMYGNPDLSGFAQMEEADVLGYLTTEIADQQDYIDANLVMAAFDLANLEKQLSNWENLQRKLTDLLKKGKLIDILGKPSSHKDSLLDVLADSFLGVVYGIMPSIRDADAAYSGLREISNRFLTDPNRYHSRCYSTVPGPLDSPIKSTHVLTAVVDRLPRDFLDGAINGLIREYQRFGLYPNAEAAWDVIPFSFLVDKIVNIGKAARAASTKQEVQFFPLEYAMDGRKRIWSPASQRLWPGLTGVSGGIDFTWYQRKVIMALPLPPEEAGKGTGLRDAWAELLALGIAKRPRH